MPKSQLFIIIIAALLVAGMYYLPKVVVDNQDKKLDKSTAATGGQANSESAMGHSEALAPEVAQKLQVFQKQYAQASQTDQKIAWLDSIASIFRANNRFDSAAHYTHRLADLMPTEQGWQRAGDAYFEAFRFAMAVDAKKADALGTKAREFYDRILAKNPKNYSAQANKAMTYVVTANPMQGIQLLRQILEQDPNNQLAMLNLGLLAIQSGQFDRAVERFEKLLALNPNHYDAKLYLAQSYAETNQKPKAIKILEELASLKIDSLAAYRETAKDYLKQLKN
jgi:tetratricopeptide (TPR) repeat protein